jgi:hypothetical protein
MSFHSPRRSYPHPLPIPALCSHAHSTQLASAGYREKGLAVAIYHGKVYVISNSKGMNLTRFGHHVSHAVQATVRRPRSQLPLLLLDACLSASGFGVSAGSNDGQSATTNAR